MPIYTFHLCDEGAEPYTFEAFDLAQDSEAYRTAGLLLDQHPHARFVAVWAGERPVLARHRQSPQIRAVLPSEARQGA